MTLKYIQVQNQYLKELDRNLKEIINYLRPALNLVFEHVEGNNISKFDVIKISNDEDDYPDMDIQAWTTYQPETNTIKFIIGEIRQSDYDWVFDDEVYPELSLSYNTLNKNIDVDYISEEFINEIGCPKIGYTKDSVIAIIPENKPRIHKKVKALRQKIYQKIAKKSDIEFKYQNFNVEITTFDQQENGDPHEGITYTAYVYPPTSNDTGLDDYINELLLAGYNNLYDIVKDVREKIDAYIQQNKGD